MAVDRRTYAETVFAPSGSPRRGMTLIELTVVIAILAVLAMLLSPRLAFLRTMSTHASSGTAIQETMQNLLTFHAAEARWPHRFDSLLSSSAAGGTPSGLYGSISGTQGLDSNLKAVLTTTQLTTGQLASLKGLLGNPTTGGGTILELMDHDETNIKPGNSGTYPRDLATSGSDTTVAVINTAHNPNPTDPNSASGSIIFNTVFPDGTNPNNEILVALGVGPKCTAVSKTIVTPPQMYLKDGTRYNRVVVVIRVRPDGVQASLAGAVSPDGRTLDQCLGNYRVTAER
jgi:prepilin-type N-terminal cleavage/methylation domain-containing protein